MRFHLRNLAQRLIGTGPVAVRPFDELCATPPANGVVPQLKGFCGELAQAPADTCNYRPTTSLLGAAAPPEMVAGTSLRRRLLSLTDVAVAGDDAVVYCPRRRLAIVESVRPWTAPAERHPLLASPRFPAAQTLPGLTLSLGTLGGGGFYHFLLEAVPRLQLARPWLAEVDQVLANGGPDSFQARWLIHAGVPANKLRWLSGLSHFRCAQLLFTNPLSLDSQPTPWLVATVRAGVSAPPTAARGTRRIWISRGDAGSRQLTWENVLLSRLGNFERVELTRLTPAEQMQTMANAAVVAGPHGAGMSGLVFCAPETRVIEFLPDSTHRPLFGRLALAAGCRPAWAFLDFARPPSDLAPLTDAIHAFAA